jgi:hypothetical protein
MNAYFDWLQNLGVSMWVAQSESLWAFPFILFVHSLGMGLSAGPAFVIGLRLIGVARPLPVSSLRVLFKIFWAGFFINLITGSLMFASSAYSIGHLPIYYAKLLLILVGVAISVPMRRFANSEASDLTIPAHIQILAALSLVVWLGVITTGRLIAYAS